ELHLVEVADFAPSPFEAEFGRHVAVSFPQREFDDLKRRLLAHGATLIDPERPTPFARFFFRNVDGYVFEVVASERLPETAAPAAAPPGGRRPAAVPRRETADGGLPERPGGPQTDPALRGRGTGGARPRRAAGPGLCLCRRRRRWRRDRARQPRRLPPLAHCPALPARRLAPRPGRRAAGAAPARAGLVGAGRRTVDAPPGGRIGRGPGRSVAGRADGPELRVVHPAGDGRGGAGRRPPLVPALLAEGPGAGGQPGLPGRAGRLLGRCGHAG